MYFENLAAALTMDGHGMFVWPAYFIAVLVIVAILIRPWRRQRKFLRLKSAELKRQQGGPSSIEEVI